MEMLTRYPALKRALIGIGVSLLIATIGGCSGDQKLSTAAEKAVDSGGAPIKLVADKNPTMVNALAEAQLLGGFDELSEGALIVPSASALDELLAGADADTDAFILKAHVVQQKLSEAELKTVSRLETAAGVAVRVSNENGNLKINDNNVTNVVAVEGVLVISIDGALDPRK